jgi:tRNA-Thr(GGU) m(6)t(6)A37 methyltransferase TsaA
MDHVHDAIVDESSVRDNRGRGVDSVPGRGGARLQEERMIPIEPIGYVRSERTAIEDDDWGETLARIELVPLLGAEALAGLDDFSHAEILFHFHRVPPERIETGARHPRDNPRWPRVGIFAQRGKNRPNRLGSTVVSIVRIEGPALVVQGLDAIDGTPVVDIKPVMSEFLPRTPVRQPDWSRALMARYWNASG